MSIEAIHSLARTFESKIRWRNAFEYFGAVIVVVSFSVQVFVGENVYIRTGSGLIALATVFVVCFLHTRGSARGMPDALGRAASMDFYRSSLERQRDLSRNVWRWYLLPFVPGLALDLIGFAVRDDVLQKLSGAGTEGWPALYLLAVTCVVVGIFFIIGVLNKRNVRKLQARIDALDERIE